MQIYVFRNAEEVASAASMVFAAQLYQKPDSVLACHAPRPFPTTGRSSTWPGGLYRLLPRPLLHLDEYVGLAPDHPQAYRRFGREAVPDIPIHRDNTQCPGLATPAKTPRPAHDRMIEGGGASTCSFWASATTATSALRARGGLNLGHPRGHADRLTGEANARWLTTRKRCPRGHQPGHRRHHEARGWCSTPRGGQSRRGGPRGEGAGIAGQPCVICAPPNAQLIWTGGRVGAQNLYQRVNVRKSFGRPYEYSIIPLRGGGAHGR
jgi:hypothetical protein